MTTTTANAGEKKGTPGRRTLRKIGRVKRKTKIHADKEFAKTYFAARSKRNADKKVTFRKKKNKK